ncbi:hypothetical protein ABZS29_33980 [Kribbella sp. NPDC005582]|uniref:hypothetical protein n=1 Tax=Kribbella sp. NPDC005582 TaxID=3156893 RepID=UPI0033B65C58
MKPARVLLLVIALAHLVIPAVMLARSDTLRGEVAAQHPDFGSSELDASVQVALTSATVFHLLLAVLCVFLAWKLDGTRRWAVRLTVVSQALSIVFSLVSWSTSAMFHAVIPVVVLLQLAVIVLVLRARRT